jgi:hypothetical protein
VYHQYSSHRLAGRQLHAPRCRCDPSREAGIRRRSTARSGPRQPPYRKLGYTDALPLPTTQQEVLSLPVHPS